jgi:uncharacterized protein
MRNPHGFPIWYELWAADPAVVIPFYEGVLGWEVGPQPDGDMDYRMIAFAGDNVGGLMRFTEDMQVGGAKPGWLFYIGVDDVDATIAKIVDHGGAVLTGPMDIPDVGRFALVADPQGVPFYVMRGAVDEVSTAYDRMATGKCSWNELSTTDQDAGNAFYATVFGWRYPDKMPMGDMGDYVFVETAGQTIGATLRKPDQAPAPGWLFYFRAPDIDAAARQVRDGGGMVLVGPVEVPGGEKIIVATDPQGAAFGVVAAGAAAQ